MLWVFDWILLCHLRFSFKNFDGHYCYQILNWLFCQLLFLQFIVLIVDDLDIWKLVSTYKLMNHSYHSWSNLQFSSLLPNFSKFTPFLISYLNLYFFPSCKCQTQISYLKHPSEQAYFLDPFSIFVHTSLFFFRVPGLLGLEFRWGFVIDCLVF